MHKLTELQEAWLRDLETTDAKQGKGALVNKDDEYCCLGRLCVVAGLKRSGQRGFQLEDGATIAGTLDGHSYSNYGLLSRDGGAQEGFLIGDINFHCLVEANDDGCTFKEIARAIRDDPGNFFEVQDEI